MKKQQSILPVLSGFLVWLLLLTNQIPYSIFELSHVGSLLLAAPLWLIPLAWLIDEKPNWVVWLAVGFGILFAVSFQIPKGILSGSLIIPWLSMALILAWQKVKQYQHKSIVATTALAAYLYLPVGIFWAIISRLGIPFMGYDPTIILLTAVHFHYAGFILPKITSWLLDQNHFTYSKWIGWGIIAGIPLVAIGISSTHFQWPGWIEVVSVSVMTIAGATVGVLHLWKGIKTQGSIPRICFSLGGIALLIGMVLAFAYGWRHVFVIETLTIPWMYAVHGTCNAVGFAGPVLIGYYYLQK